ncbi:hypothetical protein [Endozoicomonas sp. ALB032]|uniref:hypothetical protein n=1 Tax=Endozoicomonas sp. ALB032 TaxID=3403082 RepID=UPI003BB5EE1B
MKKDLPPTPMREPKHQGRIDLLKQKARLDKLRKERSGEIVDLDYEVEQCEKILQGIFGNDRSKNN